MPMINKRGRFHPNVSHSGFHTDIGIKTSNDREAQCCRELEADGWTVYKKGWPDFLAEKNGFVKLVEVKPPGGVLKRHQQRISDILAPYGLRVEVWHAPF